MGKYMYIRIRKKRFYSSNKESLVETKKITAKIRNLKIYKQMLPVPNLFLSLREKSSLPIFVSVVSPESLVT
jgi:hypothetical protein